MREIAKRCQCLCSQIYTFATAHCIGVARTSCGITPRHLLAEEDGDPLPAVVGAQLVLGLGGEWAWLRHLCCGRAGWGGALDKHIERGGEQQQVAVLRAIIRVWLVLRLGGEQVRLRCLCRARAGQGGAADEQGDAANQRAW